MIFLEFLGIFASLLILGYLLPVGGFYYWYYVRESQENDARKIQERRPFAGQIRHEVLASLQTIFIFAVLATLVWRLYLAGGTSIYASVTDYPMWYLPVSFFACLVIHDTFFYWTHRVMHWPRVFKYVHLGHHRSAAPTPWAIFSFQPLEAVLQFVPVALIVIYVPLHPLTLLVYLTYDTIVNTAGHTGYEMIPDAVARSWLFQGLNTVCHHDAHHSDTRVNFGSFFNVWDRWMGTFADASLSEPGSSPATPGAHARRSATHVDRTGPAWPDRTDRPDRSEGADRWGTSRHEVANYPALPAQDGGPASERVL